MAVHCELWHQLTPIFDRPDNGQQPPTDRKQAGPTVNMIYTQAAHGRCAAL